MGWTKIGGAAGVLIGEGNNLYAATPDLSAIWQYSGTGTQWEKIGDAGSMWVSVGNTVYGLTPDKSAVYKYQGTPHNWTRIGGPAGVLVGGGNNLYAAAPDLSAIWQYSGTGTQWEKIGDAGSMWVGVGNTVYGLTPDKSAVYKYQGTPHNWTRIGGPAGVLVGGGNNLYAAAPDLSAIWQYPGTGTQWEKIGDAGAMWVGVGNTVYGLTPNHIAVFQYDGSPGQWTMMGGPAATLATFGNSLCALTPDRSAVYMYDGVPGNWIVPTNITVSKIRCRIETDEVGADEPYVLVTAIDLTPTGGLTPNVETTLYGPWEDVDQGESRVTDGRLVWPIGTDPAEITDPDSAIFIVSLMENDNGDPEVTRGITQLAATGSLAGSVGLSRTDRVNRLIADINSAVDTPTGFPNFDDRVGSSQELRLTSALLNGFGGAQKKKLVFEGDGGKYNVYCRISAGTPMQS